MANFGPLAAEILSLVWGTPGNFNGFRVLAALLHGNLVVGVIQTAALNRGRHLYSAGRPSRWAFAHISSCALLGGLTIGVRVALLWRYDDIMRTASSHSYVFLILSKPFRVLEPRGIKIWPFLLLWVLAFTTALYYRASRDY